MFLRHRKIMTITYAFFLSCVLNGSI